MENNQTITYSSDGYIAAVLTEESVNLLKTLAVHGKIYCHHFTIAYMPNREVWGKYENLIGQKFFLETIGIAQDDKAQAVLLKNYICESGQPHITISCDNLTPPKYSAELLNGGKIQPLKIRLEAVVKFIPFK